MSVLPPASEQSSPAVADVFAEIAATRGFESHALASIGHAPEGLRHLARLGAYMKYQAALSERLRELSILCAPHGIEVESPAVLKSEQDGQKAKARIRV